jgi:hypothetical protein
MKPKTSYKASLALYPKSWKQTRVSENKICIQFNSADAKVRCPFEEQKLELPNRSEYGLFLPLRTVEDNVSCIAVGIQMPLWEDTLLGILDAFDEHLTRFDQRSLPILKKAQVRLDQLIRKHDLSGTDINGSDTI